MPRCILWLVRRMSNKNLTLLTWEWCINYLGASVGSSEHQLTRPSPLVCSVKVIFGWEVVWTFTLAKWFPTAPWRISSALSKLKFELTGVAGKDRQFVFHWQRIPRMRTSQISQLSPEYRMLSLTRRQNIDDDQTLRRTICTVYRGMLFTVFWNN